VNIKTETC